MKEVKAPEKLQPFDRIGTFSIFLGGSIDQGAVWDWQKNLVTALNDYRVILYNPRRDNWDKNWKQDLDNSEFVAQVTWEQHYLKVADYRVFVMTAESKSPITLLELGQYINKPGIVLCEPGFYRKANVEITAHLNGMPVVDSMDELIQHLKVVIAEKQWGQK